MKNSLAMDSESGEEEAWKLTSTQGSDQEEKTHENIAREIVQEVDSRPTHDIAYRKEQAIIFKD